MDITVLSTISTASFHQKAENLARNLGIPITCDLAEVSTTFILIYTESGLELQRVELRKNRAKRLLFVDFVDGKSGYRRINDSTIKQPLAKAVGIKPGLRPSVFDGTAGLGGDSFVLATLGCNVTLCERNPVMSALLQDGLTRAAAHPSTRGIVENMNFIEDDSLELSDTIHKSHDTVYLDPMYPHTASSALNKISMRIIRDIVGDDTDSSLLLTKARIIAKKRIVVKRPRLAPTLSEAPHSYQIQMKSSRYDIYLLS